jgi:hypothetical protein
MKNYYRLLMVAIFLVFINLSFLHAVDIQGEVEFNIRLYDRRIYYVTDNVANNEPIYVQITITNNSPSPYRFKLADDRSFSMDIDIRTMTNRQLPQSNSLIRKRTQNNQIFFREITIESRESFSFIEDLRDYVRFDQPGSFRVRALIYPELIRTVGSNSAVRPVASNYINLNLRPPVVTGQDGIPLEMDIATGAVLVKQPLPPDEVVTYMLTARQQSQWERFFLYLDPQAMLLRDAFQRRRYLSENEAGRRRMVENYIQNLKNSVVDGDIVVIPTSFEILRTEYNNNEGTVTVLKRFRMSNYTELRQYRYFLERRDNFWIIVNYSVQGMGTEANH